MKWALRINQKWEDLHAVLRKDSTGELGLPLRTKFSLNISRLTVKENGGTFQSWLVGDIQNGGFSVFLISVN